MQRRGYVHVRAPGLAEEGERRFDGVVCPDEVDLDYGAEGSFGEARDGREAAGVSAVSCRRRGLQQKQKQKDGAGSGTGTGTGTGIGSGSGSGNGVEKVRMDQQVPGSS